MSATLTSFPAVTVVSALVPVFLPTLTLVTPLTPLSAACTFLEHPDAHRNPVTARTVVFSSAATTSAWVLVVVTTGAAMAPVVKAAKAAIIAIVVFMFSLVARMLNYSSADRNKPHLSGVPRFFLAIRNNACAYPGEGKLGIIRKTYSQSVHLVSSEFKLARSVTW